MILFGGDVFVPRCVLTIRYGIRPLTLLVCSNSAAMWPHSHGRDGCEATVKISSKLGKIGRGGKSKEGLVYSRAARHPFSETQASRASETMPLNFSTHVCRKVTCRPKTDRGYCSQDK